MTVVKPSKSSFSQRLTLVVSGYGDPKSGARLLLLEIIRVVYFTRERDRGREKKGAKGKSDRERVLLATETISVARRPKEREKKRELKREKGGRRGREENSSRARERERRGTRLSSRFSS